MPEDKREAAPQGTEEMAAKGILDQIKESLNQEIDFELPFPQDANIQTLLNSLHVPGSHQKIGLEFSCGDCCKKVLNGARLFFVFGLAVLLPAPGDCLFMKVFSGGKLVDKQIMRAIIVPVRNICAIEIQPVQVDP
ncbi:hypothetical protein [Desulfovirgula thermocuniculi]|uniref:hypothetical protein n=1 Tax=Desulfovirgula thermocuniculi TaxID=348842 RepID=UPI0004056BBE|nr:hypothetical protein [Desulfovirgula thermocuniculi]